MSVYFSVGDAIAALGITILIPQFLRPIYIFRMNSLFIRVSLIYGIVFFGFAVICIAATLANHQAITEISTITPFILELVGAAAFALAYGILAIASLREARVRPRYVERFTVAATRLLSQANEGDMVDFASDLATNMPTLCRICSILPTATYRENAFFHFTHRYELHDAAYAASLLKIVSDPSFCRALVCQCPWVAANIFGQLAAQQGVCQESQRFVQEIARQAIVAPKSMMGRETEYGGFSHAPVLSDSIFGNSTIIDIYEPFRGLSYDDFSTPHRMLTRRLREASTKAHRTLLEKGMYWPGGSIYQMTNIINNLVSRLRTMEISISIDYGLIFDTTSTIKTLIQDTRRFMGNSTDEIFCALTRDIVNDSRRNAVDAIASMIVSTLASVSYDFENFDDKFWDYLMILRYDLFDDMSAGTAEPDILQHLVIEKLIKQVQRNRKGWYPPITRVLLVIVGPYCELKNTNRSRAIYVLASLFYRELQEMKEPLGNPNVAIAKFFPQMVSFDKDARTLTHWTRSGPGHVEALDELVIEPIALQNFKARDRGHAQ